MESKGAICSDSDGWMSIKTLEECQNAVPFIKSKIPDIPDQVKRQQREWYPKGCYAYTIRSSGFGIYFNTHQSGRRSETSREVCIDEGR